MFERDFPCHSRRKEFFAHWAEHPGRLGGYPPRRYGGGPEVSVQISLQPILALLAGILILAMPRLLNYIVAIYLIIVGLVGLFGLKL